MAGITLIFFLIANAAIFGWVFSGSAVEIRPDELAFVAAWYAIVCAVEALFAWVLFRFLPNAVVTALLAIALAVNFYFIGMIPKEAAMALKIAATIGVGVAFFGIVLARAHKPAMVFAMFCAVAFTGQYAYGRVELDPGANFAGVSMPFKNNRNVYFISFESLHSPKAFRDLYGFRDLPHVDYLRQKGFRVLDRAYSADTATRISYTRLLEFGKVVKSGSEESNAVFSEGNSTFRSFHDSGYKIQWLYVNNYVNLNPDLVEHHNPPFGMYICDNLPPEWVFGFCNAETVKWINTNLYGVTGPLKYTQEIEYLKHRVDAVVADGHPWLTINHIIYPFHTNVGRHRWNDPTSIAHYKKLIRNALPQIAANYREVMDYIIAHDPNAIIVSYGDHGGWMSRGMPDEPEANDVFTIDQFVEDRRGIMLAVYPADFCKNRIFDGSTATYLVRSVIDCLNGDDNPTDKERWDSGFTYLNGLRHLTELMTNPPEVYATIPKAATN